MKKINSNIVHIPPHISTSWDNVVAIHIKNCPIRKDSTLLHSKALVFKLKDSSVVVHGLSEETIQSIFNAYGEFLDKQDYSKEKDGKKKSKEDLSSLAKQAEELFSSGNIIGLPFQMDADGVGGLDLVMQHNPDQANMPRLPSEIVKKIVAITHSLGLNNEADLPTPEPNCNCMHCQIARAINSASGLHEEDCDEEVSEADLTFYDWDIEKTNDNLYIVTSRLDKQEQYNVYLGAPIGCTCGKANCDHIKAVLQSNA